MTPAPALRAALGEELRRQIALMGPQVPVYAALLAELDRQLDDGELLARLAVAWADRTFSSWYDRPLLMLAALNHDAAEPGHPLHAALHTEAGAAALDPSRVREALGRSSLLGLIASRSVQTNEVSRAVAWLWPCERLDLDDIALVDLGCSAGLNLVADMLDLAWIERTVQGERPLRVRRPRVHARIGYDLRPGDVHDEPTVRWLRACVWPGQRDRRARLDAAIDAARRAPVFELHAAGLVDVPARLDGDVPSGRFVLAYQTIVRDYLSADEQAAYTAGMCAWLGRHPARRPGSSSSTTRRATHARS